MGAIFTQIVSGIEVYFTTSNQLGGFLTTLEQFLVQFLSKQKQK